jgi:hypothetical protein
MNTCTLPVRNITILFVPRQGIRTVYLIYSRELGTVMKEEQVKV